MTSIRGRYAPSPTGLLHLGNARTALLAYAQARVAGGALILRVEDLDAQRSRLEFTRANLAELRWLGLNWDEGPDVGGPHGPYLQSERHAHYGAAFEALKEKGLLFSCYLSRKDVQAAASAPHEGAPVYGPAQRARNARLAPQRSAAGRTPAWRFRAPERAVSFVDLLAGPQRFDAATEVGDFVVRRADGEWAYQLAVVVDDLLMGVSHVLRGDDLLPSAAAQVLLYDAFGAVPPTFAHVPLLLDTDGKRLAKRSGALTLTALRGAGVRAERVIGLLAHSLGVLPRPLELSLEEFLARCDMNALPSEAFRLEPRHLEWLQAL